MIVGLIRHGEALDHVIDNRRPLSSFGIQQVERLALELNEKNYDIHTVFHSGILRAEQTATILKNKNWKKADLAVHPGILPESNISEAVTFLNEQTTSILLVGHMPFMAILAIQLGANIQEFSTASCIIFEKASNSTWNVIWESNKKNN